MLTYRENGVFFCILIVLKSLGFVILGFPTFGLLWPKFFRQILFTPPKPKKDEAKMQMDRLEEDVAQYKEEVEILSEKMSMQIELMQQLLAKER